MARKSQWAKLEANVRWRAALYLRLSQKEDGDTESDSINNQREMGLSYLAKEADISLFKIYIDDGFSGLNFDRPDFQRMIADLRAGHINCIIVKDLSRFGRDYIGVGQYLEREFPLMDVRFISILDHLDSYDRPDDMANALVPIKSVMNEEYCRDISRKIRSVLNNKREKGEFIGNYAPYGYQKSPNNRHRLVIDENVAWVVKEIFDLFINGMPLMQIKKHLNEEGIKTPSQYKVSQGLESFGKHSSNGKMCGMSWSITTIRRILTDEVYIGNLVQGQYKNKSYKVQKLTAVDKAHWIKVKNTHEPIVDPYTFNLVQDILSRNVRKSPKEKSIYPLSGYVKCGDCHMGMRRTGTGKYHYYVCSTYRNLPERCSKHSIREDTLFPLVAAVLQVHIRLFLDRDRLLKDVSAGDHQSFEKNLKKRIRENQEKYKQVESIKFSLYDDYKRGILTEQEYMKMKKGYSDQSKALEDAIETCKGKLKQLSLTEKREKENPVAEKLKQYENLKKLTREVVVELINTVYVYEDQSIEVVVKFQDEFSRYKELTKNTQESNFFK